MKLTDTAIEIEKTLEEEWGLSDFSANFIKAYNRLDAEKKKLSSKIQIDILVSQVIYECQEMKFVDGLTLATLRGYALGRSIASKRESELESKIILLDRKIKALEKGNNKKVKNINNEQL